VDGDAGVFGTAVRKASAMPGMLLRVPLMPVVGTRLEPKNRGGRLKSLISAMATSVVELPMSMPAMSLVMMGWLVVVVGWLVSC
jgi:hypothetical protein